MIVFRVGGEIATNLSKMISISGQNVEWNRQFAINNNTVILPGKLKSLLFNFDNRKIVGTVIEDNILTEPINMPKDRLANNAVNIILYVFGKWGLINGMTVKKDYEQLNALYNAILQEISVTVEADDKMCKFYKDSIQITFEDVFQLLYTYLIEGEEEEEQEEEDISEKLRKSETAAAKLGLWHKLVWKDVTVPLKKQLEQSKSEATRLGNNFYTSAYICPKCGTNLHMTVYKEDEENTIETSDGSMYMTRCYTCHTCHIFITPRPDKLVIEGEEYLLDFEDDEDAYFDFIRLAGRTGGRNSNPRFNWMAVRGDEEHNNVGEGKKLGDNSQAGRDEELDKTNQKNISIIHNGKKAGSLASERSNSIDETLNKVLSDISASTDADLITVADCADSGFFHTEEQQFIRTRAQKEMAKRGIDINALPAGKMRDILKQDGGENLESAGSDGRSIEGDGSKTGVGSGSSAIEGSKQGTRSDGSDIEDSKQGARSGGSAIDHGKRSADDNVHAGDDASYTEDSNSNSEYTEEETDVAGQADSDDGSNWKAKQVESTRILDEAVRRAVGLAKRNQAPEFDELIKTLSAKQLVNTVESIKSLVAMEIKNGHAKAESTASLKDYMNKTAERLNIQSDSEVENIFSKIPQKLTKETYNKFKKKLEEYTTDKARTCVQSLKERYDAVKQQELLSYISKNVKNGRNSIYTMCKQLEENDEYEESVKRPIINKMLDKVRQIDQVRVDKICAKADDCDFDEGLQLINAVKKENILPELKEDTIGKIKRRLKQLKKDECAKLVRKLNRDTGIEGMEVPGFATYDVRRMSNDTCEDTDAILFHNAIYEYASEREFEYPLIMYDSTKSGSGKKGFMITPDRLVYNLSSGGGSIDITDIKELTLEYGFFNKGIYVQNSAGYTVKIANVIKPPKQDMDGIIGKLNTFIKYLKEKPDSHNVDYLVKEKHTTKICVRCGYKYTEGTVCPKCGSKNL